MKEETHRLWSIMIQVITVLGVLYGVFSGLNSWSETQRLEKLRLQNELLGVFWGHRVKAHIDAASTAAILAKSNPGETAWKKAEKEFWELYQGRLVVVEDYEVCQAMIAFRDSLRDYKKKIVQEPTRKTVTQSELEKHALKLAKTIRNSLRKSSEDLRPIPSEHSCS